ncbi:uncharacterized protein TNCV_2473011 [Trichonephila clavipes]|nr:uncharacterized protein TNCV_2473011 [Trichonephila clavipes]
MVSDWTEFAVNDWVLVATHPLSSAIRKVVAKFKPKFEGPYGVLDVKNNNVVIWKAGKRLTINVDQVRIYRHRKCDETEIGTGSLRDESSGFYRVQRRSNESRDGKKKGSEVKRQLEKKWLSFRNDQSKKQTNNTNKRGPLIRSIPISWSEKGRMIIKSKNERLGYKRSNESRSGGPERKKEKPKGRDGNAHHKQLKSETKKREKRGVPTDHREEDTTRRTSSIQKKAEKGTIVHTSKSEQDRNNKDARRGGDQRRQDQERRGTCTKKSLSLEVLVGNAKNQVASFLFIFFLTSGRKNFCNKASHDRIIKILEAKQKWTLKCECAFLEKKKKTFVL